MQITRERLFDALTTLWPGTVLPEGLPAGRLALCRDSRTIADSAAPAVFVALPGVNVDGRRFIAQALDDGAVLVLTDVTSDGGVPKGIDLHEDARVLRLAVLDHVLGELGRLLFAVPKTLELIGVTGTNGKSSVTHYFAALSEALGRPGGLIGTLGWGRAGQLVESGLTTPGPLELQAALGAMAAQGIQRVAMEVSSHALEQERLSGCRVTAAVFTNLSRDHLDYHGSMAAYAAAKARLFKRRELKLAVVNGDDPLARLMLAGLPDGVRVLACGEQQATTLRVIDWQPHTEGQRALIATPEGERVLELALMGRFNLDNVLLAMAALLGLGESIDALCRAANQLVPVPGRMQVITRPNAPGVVVDYAHTPDALGNALKALRAHLANAGGQLWCVFGCGGDRDVGKRALMGAAAESLADRLVITDDNPRSEPPAKIRDQILAGLSPETLERTWCIDGRLDAINRAIAEAGANDVILIAGKGHEGYQEISGQRLAFSDALSAETALDARQKRL
ncbi:MAG TPA: UDP-N-acetylmuramoyl-L-alanyl-D-glutamate--2,6-diaminopimelate ligase [Modicisalibacter sp.]|nr:UDP-N-acetylmuramoyl-L-alanyl-D-glutamate--2,6-diaminopimelate ligase [Modicisalibacter sp.]